MNKKILALSLIAVLAVAMQAQAFTVPASMVYIQEGPLGATVADVEATLLSDFSIVQPADLALGGTAFANCVIAGGGLPSHQIAHLNDGIYGTGNSWIGEAAGAWCGISLGATPTTLASFAFGRNNAQGVGDRWEGTYTLQYTAVANPDELTPDIDWTEIGTLDYGFDPAGDPGQSFDNVFMRHAYNLVSPVSATGVRLVPMMGSACIDEIELFGAALEEALDPIPPAPLVITPAGGYDITWNGNDGDGFGSGAPLDNDALGATAFGDLGFSEIVGGTSHMRVNVNDGLTGNDHSWLNLVNGPAGAEIALDFGGAIEINTIAWARDNLAGSGDRCLDNYTLSVTTDPDPQDPGASWTVIGDLLYQGSDGGFTPQLRHQYDVSLAGGGGILATGLKLRVGDANTCIDELEVNTIPEPATMMLLGLGGLALIRRKKS